MSQKKRITLIVAMALAVVLIAVLAVAFVRQKSEEAERQRQTQQAQEEQAAAKRAQDALLGETYTNPQEGVSLRLPKGWEQVAKEPADKFTLIRFRNPEPEAADNANTHANGELTARQAKISFDDYVRGYIEATLNLNIRSKQLDYRDIRVGDNLGRLLSYDIPGPNGITARYMLYIFYKNETYYNLVFTTLASKADSYRATIDASVNSLEIKSKN